MKYFVIINKVILLIIVNIIHHIIIWIFIEKTFYLYYLKKINKIVIILDTE